jgi:hypothetical protein
MVAAFFVACSTEPAPVAGDPCDSIVDCARGEGLACVIDTCEEVMCERSVGCPVGAACVDGRCDDPECADNADCDDALCFEGDCRDDVCAGTDDCERGLVCRGTPPQCSEPLDVCGSDLDCPSGLFCKRPEGTCATLCDEESDCPGEAYCDGRFCREPCVATAECPGNRVCREGRCLESADCSGAACPVATPFVDPIDCSCRSCLADADCLGDGRRCLDGSCRFCPEQAESAATCTELGFLFDGECCVECLSDAQCTVGGEPACVRGGCSERSGRECGGDGDCPEGQGCSDGICRKSGSGAACALQADCPAGEACYADGRCWDEAATCDGCSAPGRCIAEDGDTEGTCEGCTDPCASDGCPAGDLCFIVAGATEGTCIAADFTPDCP